jgi:Ca2+-binding RTX toxin-like protein
MSEAVRRAFPILLAGFAGVVVTGGAYAALTPIPPDHYPLPCHVNGIALQSDATPDEMSGGAERDFLRGGPGADYMRGFESADCLFGQAGSDIILGGHEDDKIRGGKGHDDLWGGPGKDRYLAGRGDDAIHDTGGHNYINCGRGIDAVVTNHRSYVQKSCERVTRRGGSEGTSPALQAAGLTE